MDKIGIIGAGHIVDTGSLAEGGRRQHPNTSLYNMS